MPATGGLLTNRTVLLAKIESTYGTDPTPAVSANEVEVFELTIKPTSSIVDRKPLRASLSPLANAKSKWFYDISFQTELKNSGTAGTPGRLSPLFQACGMLETDNTTVSDVYTPTNPSGSCTLWIYKDGKCYKTQGCRGNFEIKCEAGKIPMVHWTFKGKYNDSVDLALPTPTYESTIGVVAESIAFTISGFAGHVKEYSLNMNNEIVERHSLNSANATIGVIIGSRKPTGKFKMEAELLATEPFETEMAADTVVSLSLVHGTVAGNIVTITSSGAQYNAVVPSDDNGLFTQEVEFALSSSAGDTEVSISLT